MNLRSMKNDIIKILRQREPLDDQEICLDTLEIAVGWISVYFDNLIYDSNRLGNKKEVFDKARKLYPGTKRGLDTEFDNFVKKTKDWRDVNGKLFDAIIGQIRNRKRLKDEGGFVPEWKNFRTWINQRCWEEEYGHKSSANQAPDLAARKTRALTMWMEMAANPQNYTFEQYTKLVEFMTNNHCRPITPEIDTESLRDYRPLRKMAEIRG